MIGIKKISFLLFGLALSLGLAACGTRPAANLPSPEDSDGAPGGDTEQTPEQPPQALIYGKLTLAKLELGGLERSYYYYIPSTYEPGQQLPLLLSIHGSGQNATMQLREGQWIELAEREGFLVLAPNAVAIHSDGTLSCEGATSTQLGVLPKNVRFNSGTYDPIAEKGIDDVAYFCALLDAFDGYGLVDTGRVYASGISNGACMAIRLAVEVPERFAGIGPVAGLLYTQFENEVPSEAMTVVFVNGTEDPIVPIEGMVYSGWVFARSLEESIDWFKDRYGITAEPVVTPLEPADINDPTRITRHDYGSNGAGSVVAYVVEGGGHTWPGGTQYGPVATVGVLSRQAQASELIWAEFMAR